MSHRPLIATFLTAIGLSPAASAADWTNLGGNAGRNGRTTATGPTQAVSRWAAADFSIIAWYPFILADRVYTIRQTGFPQAGGAANDALVCYDAAGGAECWRVTLPYNGNPSSQWIAWIAGARDGRVYVSRSSHTQPQPIIAYDAGNGAFLWESRAATQAFAYDGAVFAPSGDLIVGDFQNVYRIRAADGSTVWTHPRICSVSGNCGPAATDTAVFIDQPAPGGIILTKLDITSGAVMYSSSLMPGFTEQNNPFVSPDGFTVFLSRTQNNPAVDHLFAFEDTGTALVERWRRAVRWTTSHEFGIAADGGVYTFTAADEFVRLDPLTGAITANAGVLSPLGGPNASPKTAVDAAGTVYVSNGWANSLTNDGRVWAFDAGLTTNYFTLTLNTPNAGGPALGADGTLVVADRLGVYAYRTPPCPAGRGDANCDGAVNFFDIDPFLLALFDLPAYTAAFCGGAICAADVDCSGDVTFFDIDPLLGCLFGACPPCP